MLIHKYHKNKFNIFYNIIEYIKYIKIFSNLKIDFYLNNNYNINYG